MVINYLGKDGFPDLREKMIIQDGSARAYMEARKRQLNHVPSLNPWKGSSAEMHPPHTVNLDTKMAKSWENVVTREK